MATRTRPHWHDAYDAQMGLWRWYRTEGGQRFLQAHYEVNAPSFDHPNTRTLLQDLITSEWGRLLDLDPIYVSREMCELVDQARDSFAPEPLLMTDLITPRGFLYYDKPFIIPDRFEEPTNLQAVSWVPFYNLKGDIQFQERISAMLDKSDTDTDLEVISKMIEDHGYDTAGISLTLYQNAQLQEELTGTAWPARYHVPTVVPLHMTPWYYGMTFDGNEWDLEGKPTGAEWWWRVLQTTFRLMIQQITVKHRERPDRPMRREAKRVGFPDEREVVVVRLRRERGERHEPQSEANYSHRFVRSGHWRNQWYPSIQQRRQIWIDPTIVGDPSLPLIVRPRRVFQWER
jgi:hypothetical protein